MRFCPFFAAALLLAAAPFASARTLLHVRTLIDVRSDAPKETMTVDREGAPIFAVESGYATPVVRPKAATIGPLLQEHCNAPTRAE